MNIWADEIVDGMGSASPITVNGGRGWNPNFRLALLISHRSCNVKARRKLRCNMSGVPLNPDHRSAAGDQRDHNFRRLARLRDISLRE